MLVNAVVPGTTLTEHVVELVPAEARAARERASPVRRLLTPEEVAPVIAFLGSPADTGTPGELARVSGGCDARFRACG